MSYFYLAIFAMWLCTRQRQREKWVTNGIAEVKNVSERAASGKKESRQFSHSQLIGGKKKKNRGDYNEGQFETYTLINIPRMWDYIKTIRAQLLVDRIIRFHNCLRLGTRACPLPSRRRGWLGSQPARRRRTRCRVRHSNSRWTRRAHYASAT